MAYIWFCCQCSHGPHSDRIDTHCVRCHNAQCTRCRVQRVKSQRQTENGKHRASLPRGPYQRTLHQQPTSILAPLAPPTVAVNDKTLLNPGSTSQQYQALKKPHDLSAFENDNGWSNDGLKATIQRESTTESALDPECSPGKLVTRNQDLSNSKELRPGEISNDPGTDLEAYIPTTSSRFSVLEYFLRIRSSSGNSSPGEMVQFPRRDLCTSTEIEVLTENGTSGSSRSCSPYSPIGTSEDHGQQGQKDLFENDDEIEALNVMFRCLGLQVDSASTLSILQLCDKRRQTTQSDTPRREREQPWTTSDAGLWDDIHTSTPRSLSFQQCLTPPQKKRLWSHSSNGNDESLNDGHKKVKVSRSRAPDNHQPDRQLACPFYKLNPYVYSMCADTTIRTISKLGSHLRAAHTEGYYCSACRKTFDSDVHKKKGCLLSHESTSGLESALNEEGRRFLCATCHTTFVKKSDYVHHQDDISCRSTGGPLVENLKISKAQGQDAVARWNWIWDNLFPETLRPESPWYDKSDSTRQIGLSILNEQSSMSPQQLISFLDSWGTYPPEHLPNLLWKALSRDNARSNEAPDHLQATPSGSHGEHEVLEIAEHPCSRTSKEDRHTCNDVSDDIDEEKNHSDELYVTSRSLLNQSPGLITHTPYHLVPIENTEIQLLPTVIGQVTPNQHDRDMGNNLHSKSISPEDPLAPTYVLDRVIGTDQNLLQPSIDKIGHQGDWFDVSYQQAESGGYCEPNTASNLQQSSGVVPIEAYDYGLLDQLFQEPQTSWMEGLNTDVQF
ncbi:hypothetical protein F5Y16DRAFT_62605 [Xylariaceae sp. FL0255]|nr:hypothetical protein F5Y16DRAFT_62605 [Xylariaceae sp. FL0255]